MPSVTTIARASQNLTRAPSVTPRAPCAGRTVKLCRKMGIRLGWHAQVQNLPSGMHIWLGEEPKWVDEASFVPMNLSG
jgi:hypothetical protein